MDSYEKILKKIEEEYDTVRPLKESDRSQVSMVRHRVTGTRYVLRRFTGGGEAYRKLLGVSCPYLPQICEVGERDGEVIVLEEYIQGDTLSFVLEGGALTVKQAKEVLSQLCAALWVLHQREIVHRDIKPDNVMLRGDEAVLIDLDASRIYKEEKEQDTQILGTTGYAAPEQYGMSQSDERADIYSLGVLLNQMLTGQHPSKQLVAGRMGRIVQKCTMVQPSKRYPSVLHLLESLSVGARVAIRYPNEETVKMPRTRRKKFMCMISALLLVMALAFGISRYHAPQVYEGAAEVVYTLEDKEYHVLVSFMATDGVIKRAQEEASIELAPGMEGAFPAQLYIYREDTDGHVWEEFMAQVKSCTVEAKPLDGAKTMQVYGPEYTEDFPFAAQKADIVYTTACGTNEIRWTLTMKNGDEIRLYQRIVTTEKDVVCYYPEKTAMNTVEELQALLDRIAQEEEAGKAVEIYLPPVIYDQEIQVGEGAYTFYGGSDGETHTTFTKTVTLETDSAQQTEFYGIRFVGEGGTGVLARSATLFIDCYFTGWDVAAVARHGGWVDAINSTFENNGVGMQMDTLHSVTSSFYYRNNRFVGNDTAFLISQLYGNAALPFEECMFSGNGKNIDNPAEYPVDTSGAVFE